MICTEGVVVVVVVGGSLEIMFSDSVKVIVCVVLSSVEVPVVKLSPRSIELILMYSLKWRWLV